MQENNQKKAGVSESVAAGTHGGFRLMAIIRKVFACFKLRKVPSENAASARVYPMIAARRAETLLPISFVVIRFSGEYQHNFLKSESVHEPLNEVIEVDNTSNLYYDNLSQAISVGLEKAQNDIIAVIHEDVLLPDGWQFQFQHTLRQLEDHDPCWGMLGSVGWDASGCFIGHWSDPHQFKNTFQNSECDFQEAEKLDEQLLIFHRDRAPTLDRNLPGIHFLGEDLKHELSRIGLKTYAINAPTIHKYADKHGERIISSTQSDKISDRESATYLADEACCKDYVRWKYPELFLPEDKVLHATPLDVSKRLQLERPVIVICKGDWEASVFSRLMCDSGVFLAGESGEPDHVPELMLSVYKMIVEKFRCHAPWQKSHTARSLQSSSAQLISALPAAQSWGFVFPESILVLPELSKAFPDARYIYLQLDPLVICEGEIQRTARLNNHIGRIALPEAYSYLGIARAQILDDEELDHMVYTTIHQLELVSRHLVTLAESNLLELRFDTLLENPRASMEKIGSWLGSRSFSGRIPTMDIEDRSKVHRDKYPVTKVAAAADRLALIRGALGYI